MILRQFEGIAKTNTTNTLLILVSNLFSLRVLLKQIQQTPYLPNRIKFIQFEGIAKTNTTNTDLGIACTRQQFEGIAKTNTTNTLLFLVLRPV